MYKRPKTKKAQNIKKPKNQLKEKPDAPPYYPLYSKTANYIKKLVKGRMTLPDSLDSQLGKLEGKHT